MDKRKFYSARCARSAGPGAGMESGGFISHPRHARDPADGGTGGGSLPERGGSSIRSKRLFGRLSRSTKVFLAGFLVIGAVLGLLEVFMPFGPFDRDFKPVLAQSLKTGHVIAHAMGGIDGITYSNSMEAFQLNYSKGFRVFEVDLMLTADKKVVAFHEGLEEEYGLDRPVSEISARQFKNTKYHGSYTPLNLADIVELLSSHPDAVIVPDVKSDFETAYRVIIRDVGDRDPALLDRIVPQIYNKGDYFTLKKLHDFERIIFTLYRIPLTSRIKLVNYWIGRGIVRFLSGKEDIVAVTMSRLRFLKSGLLVRSLQRMNRDVLVHTLNDEKVISQYLSLGATGIYTDDFDGWVKQ